jgi:hypothetical protein
VESKTISGMRHKAKYEERRAERIFTQGMIECAYMLSQPGCALLSTLVDLAIGSKGVPSLHYRTYQVS